MATELSFDASKKIARIKIKGRTGSGEILETFDLAVASEEYAPGMGRLWDFTEVDLRDLDSATIREMARYSARFPPGIGDVRVAFVVKESMVFGLTRMFQAYSDAHARTSVQIFETVESAEAWMTEDME